MWLSNSKKYAMDRFLEERASGGSVHQVVRHGNPLFFKAHYFMQKSCEFLALEIFYTPPRSHFLPGMWRFDHSPALANLNTTTFCFGANSIFNNYLEVRMPSFQSRPFNNPNFITSNEGGVEKSLPFHVDKEIGYGIIRINYIGMRLRLVSQIFVVVTCNINLALSSEKGAIKIFLFELFRPTAFNPEFSKTTSCQISYTTLSSNYLLSAGFNNCSCSITSFSLA